MRFLSDAPHDEKGIAYGRIGVHFAYGAAATDE